VKTILIIDDDPDLLLALSFMLKGNGYTVNTALAASSAIALAQTKVPHLIILDLRIPAAEDGFLLLKRIKSTAVLLNSPVIVLSSAAAADNAKRALQCGAVAFLEKPPDRRELLIAIRQALGEVINLSTFLRPDDQPAGQIREIIGTTSGQYSSEVPGSKHTKSQDGVRLKSCSGNAENVKFR
jgi:DNA-binding NtrC family response regulator